ARLEDAPRREDRADGLADDVVATPPTLTGEASEQLDGAARVPQRGDEGLLNAQRPVDGALVAPGLELVGERAVPAREAPGLVVAIREDEAREPVASQQAR